MGGCSEGRIGRWERTRSGGAEGGSGVEGFAPDAGDAVDILL